MSPSYSDAIEHARRRMADEPQSRFHREEDRVWRELSADKPLHDAFTALPPPLGLSLVVSLALRRCLDMPTPFRRLNALLGPSSPHSPEQRATNAMRFVADTISLLLRMPYTGDSAVSLTPTGSLLCHSLLAKRHIKVSPTSDGTIVVTSNPQPTSPTSSSSQKPPPT